MSSPAPLRPSAKLRAAVAKTGLALAPAPALANHMTLPLTGTKTWARAGRARRPTRRPFKPV